MNFKDEIKSTIISCNNYVEIFSKGKKYKGYGLFKKITKNLKQYFGIREPNEIGQVLTAIYSIWVVSNDKFEEIDYLIFNNKKYSKLYQKYRDETGCFEIIATKKELNE